MKASEVYQALEDSFRPQECTEVFSVIGLQHHNTDNIDFVYTATFASGEVFDTLERMDARSCMLFTHHPLPQNPSPGSPYREIPQQYLRMMKERGITLFSYHIPLDRNGPYSPGTCLAAAIGVQPYGEFYQQNNVTMGLLCSTPFTTLAQVSDALAAAVGHPVKAYPYGGESLPDGRIAIMAGGAKNPDIYAELRAKGVRALVTGVTNPAIEWVGEIHAAAKEQGVSLIGGGHYSTERFAPAAMCGFFEKLGLPALFIPEEPNLNEL